MAIIKRYQSPIYGNYKLGILKYGLLTGITLCLVVLLRKALYMPIDQPLTYVEDIVLLACMFVFTYLYRKKITEKKLFFKEIYILNVGIGIVSALVYGVFIVIYAQSIDPALCERYYLLQYQKLDLNAVDLVAKLEELKLIASPKNLGTMSFILTTILGFIFALIVGIFMRTEKNVVRLKQKH